MASIITLCNRALDAVAKANIATLDEGSLEAQACSKEAEPLLAEMVDWSDSFSFARTRVALAPMTNDRDAEWLYSYAAPSDMGAPLAIRMAEEAATGLPISGPFTFPLQDAETLAYVHEGGRIYTNVEDATLIYSRSTLDAGDLPPLGQRAFVLELAARIATPLTKDAKIAQAVAQQAEIARRRFIADEENKNPRPAARYTSEAEWARAGYGV